MRDYAGKPPRPFPGVEQRLQPVTRQAHWILQCQCGEVLAECACERIDKKVEVWKDGCAFKARWQPAQSTAQPRRQAPPPSPVSRRFRGKNLRAKRAAIVRAVLQGSTAQAIAREYGVTPAAIAYHLRKAGLPPRVYTTKD